MDRARAMDILKGSEAELRRRGVLHVALFGSVARGEATPESDVDVMLELDPAAPISAFDYAAIVHFVQGLFEAPVDVANRDSLKPHVRPNAIRDAIDAF